MVGRLARPTVRFLGMVSFEESTGMQGTMVPTSFGFARSLSYCCENWLSAKTLPLIELRVVSLPPTISKTMLPTSCFASMSLVGP